MVDAAEPHLDGGLSEEKVARRRRRYGANAIESKRTSPLKELLSFLWGPIPWMIEAAAVLSAVARRWEGFAIISAMLLLNAGVFRFMRRGHRIEERHLARIGARLQRHPAPG